MFADGLFLAHIIYGTNKEASNQGLLYDPFSSDDLLSEERGDRAGCQDLLGEGIT